MKWFTDGDRVVVTKDDFVDLQESPAVFVSSDSRAGRAIVLYGIRGLALEDLRTMEEMLDCGGGDWINRGSKVHMEKIHRGPFTLDGENAATWVDVRGKEFLHIFPFVRDDDGAIHHQRSAGPGVMLNLDAQLRMTDLICVPIGGCDGFKDAMADVERLRAVLKYLESGTKDMGALGVRPLYIEEVREIAFDALHGGGIKG